MTKMRGIYLMMNLDIRTATRNDVPALAEMTAEIQQLHHQAAPTLFTAVADNLSEFRAYIETYMESGTVYVANVEGQAVGCALYKIHEITENLFLKPHVRLHLDQMGVRPAWRRRGIGYQLMKQVLTDARENNIDFITLNVFRFNTEAIQFYESFGFEHRNMTMRLLI